MKGEQPVYGVPDEENPEWTAEDFRAVKPFEEVFPDVVPHRGRGPQKTPTKRMVSLRLDGAVLERWRASGKGWQGRMNETLARHAPKLRRARPASTRPTAKPAASKRTR